VISTYCALAHTSLAKRALIYLEGVLISEIMIKAIPLVISIGYLQIAKSWSGGIFFLPPTYGYTRLVALIIVQPLGQGEPLFSDFTIIEPCQNDDSIVNF
jgi:hypothetical protein